MTSDSKEKLKKLGKLKVKQQDMRIQKIIEDIKNGEKALEEKNIEPDFLEYNGSIILKPEFQREYRFTIAEESSLIESVLLGIPIPPIFLSSRMKKGIMFFDVVDGQHRLTAFYRFIRNCFKLKNLPLLKKLEGKKFEDLDKEDQLLIYNNVLSCYVFEDLPGKEVEIEIFSRYNKGTKALTPQEIRNAVYRSDYNDYVNEFIKLLDNDENYKQFKEAYNITKDRTSKKKVQESVFVLLYILEFGINKEFKNSLVYAEEYMKEVCEREDNIKLEQVKGMFDKFNIFLKEIITCKNIQYPFSKEIYGIASRNYKFQMSIAMILVACYKKVIDKKGSIGNIEVFLEKFSKLLLNSFVEDPDYRASTTNSEEIKKLVDIF